MNPDGLLGLLYPPPGRTRQATSNDRDPERGFRFAGLRPKAALQKRILLEPGEEHTIASIPGPGLITRLWMTALPLNPRLLRGLVLRFYWDGETHPSVESPLGDFFGAPFGRYVPYLSLPLGLTGGGFISYWPMPFSNSARLVVTNAGGRRVDPLYYQVTYVELDETLETDLRFHARWLRECPTAGGRPYTALEAHGKGHYVGCHIFLQNREWWLRPPWREVAFPRAFGLGMLEGRGAIHVDEETEPSIRGTGTEDDFGGGFYYLPGRRFSGLYHGCTVRDYLRGRFALYRFDINSPVSFKRSIRVTLDHGLRNERSGDYSSVAYWYQTEPHQAVVAAEPLRREVSTSTANVAQMALVFGVPLLVFSGLAGGLRAYLRIAGKGHRK
jgi:hypothetical protein